MQYPSSEKASLDMDDSQCPFLWEPQPALLGDGVDMESSGVKAAILKRPQQAAGAQEREGSNSLSAYSGPPPGPAVATSFCLMCSPACLHPMVVAMSWATIVIDNKRVSVL